MNQLLVDPDEERVDLPDLRRLSLGLREDGPSAGISMLSGEGRKLADCPTR